MRQKCACARFNANVRNFKEKMCRSREKIVLQICRQSFCDRFPWLNLTYLEGKEQRNAFFFFLHCVVFYNCPGLCLGSLVWVFLQDGFGSSHIVPAPFLWFTLSPSPLPALSVVFYLSRSLKVLSVGLFCLVFLALVPV